MALRVAEQLRPHPGKELLEELQLVVRPRIDQPDTQIESPDTLSQVETHLASLSKRERKIFYIQEMSGAAETLSEISTDLEKNLFFYNTAPDRIVENRLMHFFFPNVTQDESTVEKPEQEAIEVATNSYTPASHKTREGSREQWRRRVKRGVDIFLEERQAMKKISAAWNDPEAISRNEFRALVLFNHELIHEPEMIMTPLAMILILDDEDYDLIVDNDLFDQTSPGDSGTSGVAITRHTLFPAASGRMILIRRSEDDPQRRDAIIRHELFHLYFYRFIRKENLSKVAVEVAPPESINTIPLAKQLIADTLAYLRSNILEETCAYLFNEDFAIETDKANGFAWEQIISRIKLELKSEVSPEEIDSLVKETRRAQAEYLKESRALQIQIAILFDYLSTDTKNESDDETVRLNLLFLLSQWGPSRMDEFAKRLGVGKADISQEESSQKSSLRADMYKMFHDVKAGKKDVSTGELIYYVKKEVSWLYCEESIENLARICRLLLRNSIEDETVNTFLRALENSIIVRQEPLSQLEVELLSSIRRELKSDDNKKLQRHAGMLKRLSKEFAPVTN